MLFPMNPILSILAAVCLPLLSLSVCAEPSFADSAAEPLTQASFDDNPM
jgi:hypothetical protein